MRWQSPPRTRYCHHSVSHLNRRIAFTAALVLCLSVGTASPAFADEVAAHVAGARSGSLPVVASADQVAGASAASQAAAGRLYHADLSGLLGPCDSVGEVVGTGPNVAVVFSGFRDSPAHMSIITNPAWTAMGTGQATGADGRVYISVVFCDQAGSATPAVAPPVAVSPPAPLASTAWVAPASSLDVPTLDRPLPALGARRAEIRARLDQEAESMLPDWYIGVCGTDDRERVLESTTSESGACPLAS